MDITELDELEKLDELVEKREALMGHHDPDAVHFVWILRGGKWTVRERGVAFDCFRAMCRTRESKAFCTLYGLKQSIGFSIRKYREDICRLVVSDVD